MSITFNHSDFQCLQDQLVELRTKNYELNEKSKRDQADFQAAKAKICDLQLKLEEQERDFSLTSTTLRREIETFSSANRECDKEVRDDEYKAKYKKLLHKAKELQQRYEKSLETMQQLVVQNKSSAERIAMLEGENAKLLEDLKSKNQQLESLDADYQEKFEKAVSDYRSFNINGAQDVKPSLKSVTEHRNKLEQEVERLTQELIDLKQSYAAQSEQCKITEKKGVQIVKEMKRQLATEKSKVELLQQRLENLLKNPIPPNNDLETHIQLSNSSSTNGNGSSSNGTGKRTNQDSKSTSSWNFINSQPKDGRDTMQNETLSLCSINSDECETVQQPFDTTSEDLMHITNQNDTINNTSKMTSETSRQSLVMAISPGSPPVQTSPQTLQERLETLRRNLDGCPYSLDLDVRETVKLEDQVVLMDRLTKMQEDNWKLEEKLAYLEQANLSLSEDLASKSDIIRGYFMEQANKAIQVNQNDTSVTTSSPSLDMNFNSSGSVNRRASITSNVQNLLLEKPGLKKVVDFLKERQLAYPESEAISREAMKKMQVMLEETLIKCNGLQKNLDFVTSELNNSKRRT